MHAIATADYDFPELPTAANEELLELPPYVFHPASHEVDIAGATLRLTTKEFDLAYLVFRRPGQPLSRRLLSELIWGHGPLIESRTLDAHMSRIRRKLAIGPDKGWRLISIYGFGYCLQPARTA